ncbi:hypothetical protein HDE69_003239 [Pedobacter cryoconitis]|uniref:Long-subunit fatty acid transport protein n=1 Tax=Pedobacter cryoconitis TaxID=188932 RepID=A0A7W8YUR7_9SPHI|nr:outer membrane protein transport protein [Pedobacter cryoconitis]MBB5622174.1 hypothetical protein [Pedobacter cryoconitis]
MKKFIQILAVAIVATTGNIYAQSIYAGDALRFSRTDYGSSARFKGLGNAQTSLGGDISSIGGNPAGLGMFTRSEFSVTPEFNIIQANSNYLGKNTNTSKDKFNLNQAAAVWYNPVVRPKGSNLNKGVVSLVFGIGYNRNNDFSIENNYSGRNTQSSIATDWAQRANGYTPGSLNQGSIEKAAFDNYLIDKVPGTTDQYVPATSATNNTQSQNEVRRGSTSELNFSGAMNISNNLYLGASIGFVNVRYETSSAYSETGTIVNNPSDASDKFNQPNPYVGTTYNLLNMVNSNTSGAGITGRLGLIYKPVEAVRLGATFQAPTWMHMEVNSSETLDTRFSGGTELPLGDYMNTNFNYNVRTPYKGSLGASFIIGQNALLTADVDYVDYKSTKLSESDGYPDVIISNNNFIKNNYTSAVNFRVGGEYKIDLFSLRAGYGYSGTPYKEDPGNLSAIKSYSGGIGYRINQYYIDLAYQRIETNNFFNPYYLDDNSQPLASTKVARNNIFMTVGVRF